ncbi:MAG: SDR family NAD(P)-dependent oxidoreductase [Actinomycetota bacterium]|nr:SDR family NAD(P)-dependent oxidoreductase [Actinomycetota bacterium]
MDAHDQEHGQLLTEAAKRALVTGGAGFIGSTLVDRLLADGWTVSAVDSLDVSLRPRDQTLRNLDGAMRSSEFELIEGDTREAAAVRDVAVRVRPSVIFDLAARAGVRLSMSDPLSYIDVNVRGLQNTLSAAATVGAQVVFASSSSIYGNDPRRPFREDQAQGRPTSPYGATKIAGEALVHAHHEATGLPVRIARLFTVYGPRQRPDLAIYSFANRMLDGEPIGLFANGLALRDYTYVDDVVEALVRMALSPDVALTINVGSHRPIQTRAVVAELERALQTAASSHLMPPQPGDVEATFADITRARERLGWEPEVPFSVGIDRFCDWLRAERG